MSLIVSSLSKDTTKSFYIFTICLNTEAIKQWLQQTPVLMRPIKKGFIVWVDNEQYR